MQACPGIGPTKARRLYEAFHEPFRRTLGGGSTSAAGGSQQRQEQQQQEQQEQQQQQQGGRGASAVGAGTAGMAILGSSHHQTERERHISLDEVEELVDEDDDFV